METKTDASLEDATEIPLQAPQPEILNQQPQPELVLNALPVVAAVPVMQGAEGVGREAQLRNPCMPPPIAIVYQPDLGHWHTNICDCCREEETCWWAWWCPVLIHARTVDSAGIMDSWKDIVIHIGIYISWIPSIFLGFPIIGVILSRVGLKLYRAGLRSRLRETSNIFGSFCLDFIMHCFCSYCAISQEAREVKIAGKPYRDLATGQDLVSNPLPGIPNARNASICAHFKAISKCSYILIFLGILYYMIEITIIACFADPAEIAFYPMVMIIPLIILYFIYWRRNREEIPLDTIIKLFMVGATVSALAAGLINTVLIVLFMLLFGTTNIQVQNSEDDNDISYPPEILVYFVLFVISYGVAGLVEESIKHLIVRGCWLPHRLRSPQAVTIALVTGALGFTVRENIEYIFRGRTTGDMFKILGLRAITPAHAIFAALQAYGVIRRDFENIETPLYQILGPAIFMHGTFDFVLMSVAFALRYEDEFTLTIVELSLAVVMTVGGSVLVLWLLREQGNRLRQGQAAVALRDLIGDGHQNESELDPTGDVEPEEHVGGEAKRSVDYEEGYARLVTEDDDHDHEDVLLN
ncbi:hypothetical protein AAMO2058_001401900 [Amorphochlora amoebiformis]